MPRGNPSPKLAITVDPEVHERILSAAARDGVSVSAWMTNAAREALQRRAGLAAIAQWEEQHGRFSEEEMTEARRRVGGQITASRKSPRPA
jgi:predicted transcriptional regulator